MPEETKEIKTPKYSDEEKTKILKLAKKRRDKSVKAFTENYSEALEMLRFKHGLTQWTEEEKQERKDANRACEQVNELPKYSMQVCGEGRKNKVRIKVLPSDNKASQANAKIREGLIKNIEYVSDCDSIYDHARKMVVDGGFGAWRVLTRYTDENPFLEEPYFLGLDNPFCVHLDPDAKKSFWEDGEFAFVDDKITLEEFQEKYGEDMQPGVPLDSTDGQSQEKGYDKDAVLISEYFFKEYTTKQMCLLSDDQILEKADAEAFIANAKELAAKAKQTNGNAIEQPGYGAEDRAAPAAIPKIIKTREVKEPHIKWMKITGSEILEEGDWPGQYIPIVLVTGEYTNIGGKKYWNGLFKHAKGVQRMLNNVYTSFAEVIALIPKAPWLVTAKMIEGYENDYKNANKVNFPFLKYRADEKFPGAKPERQFPDTAPQGLMAHLAEIKQNLKDTIGMFNADVGDQGRELSGKAIKARQQPGDTATYLYHDNMEKGIAYGGKIINDVLSHTHDTEREVKMLGEDGKDSTTLINTTVQRAREALAQNPQKFSGIDKNALMTAMQKGPNESFNHISEGKYGVVISTGPAYDTQRQEAAENMIKLVSIFGRTNPIDKYYALLASDIPGVDGWAEAVKKTLPPGIVPQKEGEERTPPPPPSPQSQLAMAKVQFEMLKQKKVILETQLKMLEVQKAAAETSGGMKKVALDTLAELNTPMHPADNMPMRGA